MSIFQLINEIHSKEIVLPAIQRDFVWDEERIRRLFDSVLRGYPIGITLLWETYEPLQYREFVPDHSPGMLYQFSDNKKGRRLKLVLDGQQRLSSFYVALKGSFDGKKLYFNILSGRDSDDYADTKYDFRFGAADEIAALNESEQAYAEDRRQEMTGVVELAYWLRVSDIVGQYPRDLVKQREEIAEILSLDKDDRVRMELNFGDLSYALSENEEVLKTQTIDSKLPADDKKRKSQFDILEIFVRVNTEGMRLSRSDLIVSMLRLYWQDASDLLPKFVKEMNDKNGLGIDNDFVIRCMFAVAGMGTKLDFTLLRKKSNVDAIKRTYKSCFDAIRAVADFVRIDCSIDSERLLGGKNTLVPFVYYLFYAPKHRFSETAKENARKAFFLFAFSKIFTQHYESRTAAFIRDHLPSAEQISKGEGLTFADAAQYVYWKTNLAAPDHRLFGNNTELLLSLVQNRTGGKVHYPDNVPEIDHIFPRSVLAEKGVDQQDIEDIGNKWILPRERNRNKSATHPKSFVQPVADEVLKAAYISRDSLDYRTFSKFVRHRRDALVRRAQQLSRLNPADFASLEEKEAAQ